MTLCPRIFAICFATLRQTRRTTASCSRSRSWRETFLNDADLDLARSAYDKLSPEPYQQIIEPLDLKRFYTLDIPRSYLLGTEDIALPPGEWGWHPRMTSRLGLHRFVQMPGGHELLFSNPNGLADRIIESGRD